MAKPKIPTPQEARKQREENEKEALLPPGLINHGNTCFMNSVLQGLISTRPLFDLVLSPHQSLTAAGQPITLRRSPQLTNGHGFGREYEQAWVEGMPLGDVFVQIMQRAWRFQQQRRRENLSPKELLTALGRKYDQYLDFAQQDAHEFLRQLLDAMRMEELDIIKERRSSRSQEKRHHKLPEPSSSQSSPNARNATRALPLINLDVPEEEKLTSFVDMLFGGKLTSILVCQKCKHVSQSFEDFNDLSLSIKPEDYTYESKRHRLKMLAKKLASFPATLGVNMESPSIQRSSSVPPTPREETSFGGVYDVPVADPRRRSLDFAAVSDGAGIVDDDDSSGLPSPPEAMVDSGGGVVSKGHKIGFAEEPMADMKLKKEWGEKERDDDKKKDGDGWAKFGRRLSMKVGLGKGHKEQKEQKTRPRGRQTIKGVDVPSAVSEDSNSSQSFTMPRSSTSDAGRDKMPPPEARGQVETASVSMASRPIQGHTQTLVTTPTAIVPNAPLTPPFRISQIQRSKSPRPPNPTAQQSAYMQQILADITPASSNPFAFLKPSHNGEPPSSTTTAQLWLKMGQLPGIEECLKMFTAVEILDGENKVGCRRCWKIANGVHKTRPQYQGSDSDESEKPDLESDRNGVGLGKEALPVRLSSSAPSSPTLSATTPPSLLYTHWNLSDSISISTLPTTMSSESATSKSRVPPPLTLNDDSVGSGGPFRGEENRYIGSPAPHMYMTPPESPILTARPSLSQNTGEKSEESLPEQLRTYAGFTIPVISTTAPETPSPVTPRPPAHFDMTYHLTPSVSRHSLLGHSRLRRRRPNESDIDSMDGSSEAESDTSASTCPDDHSDTSTLSSATNVAEDELLHPRRQSRPPSPRSKQIIMRPAYKRYLIATPPPILVIHLKRFQHLAKTHTISFSNGFKKLDDFVTFPEYLDLKPFLAPKKEDFGLGKGVKLKAHDKGQSNEEQRCMYRLYAVVVHIGNMLGGHYVAYTALPKSTSATDASCSGCAFACTSDKHSTAAKSAKSTRQWAYISDNIVRLATLEEVLKVKAYICMYERI